MPAPPPATAAAASPGRAGRAPTGRAPGWRRRLGGWLVLVAGAAAVSLVLDPWVEGWARRAQEPTVRHWASRVSHYLDWPGLMLAAAAASGLVGAAAWWRRRRRPDRPRPDLARWRRLVLAMVLASSLAGTSVNLARIATGRTRPNAKHVAQGWYGLWDARGPGQRGRWLGWNNAYHSFPSGHTATAVGFFVPLALELGLWPCGWLALVVAAAVAGSRLYLGVHHFSDVVVAGLVAAACGHACWERLRRPRRPPAAGVAPAAARSPADPL